ncbi:MAG: transposase [Gammaproteobacteria bacterium]|nr:transposase [Gammaproteobacteria bacterium]
MQAPGATGTDYRIHAGINLVTLAITDVQITDKHTGETLKNFKLGQGDVAIADRGCCHANAILEKQNEGADVIVRYCQATMPLYHDDGTHLNLMSVLKSNKSKELHVFFSAGGAEDEEKACGWIHVIALPKAQADAARSRCHADARRRGSTPSVEALFLAGYIIVFTTLPPHILSTQMILKIYRCRWQIELVFKRWKSLLDADKLRARRGGKLAEFWLHGKLLYAMMLEKRMRGLAPCKWGNLDGERDGTWWRLLKLLRHEVDPIITGVRFWREENWADALKVLSERPRKRKLQKMVQLMTVCRNE